MNNPVMITAALTAYYVSKSKILDEFALKGFLRRVKDFDDPEILEAIEEARFSGEFPDVTVPLKFLQPQEADYKIEAGEEWREFMTGVMSSVPKFSNPITAYLAQSTVNIYEVKHGPESDLKWAEKKFIEAYVDAKKSDTIKSHIIQKCLSGGTPMLRQSALDKLNEQENKKLGLGEDDKKIGGGE